MDDYEEVEGPTTLEGDDTQLVLPSGITVGHRSLMRLTKLYNILIINFVLYINRTVMFILIE